MTMEDADLEAATVVHEALLRSYPEWTDKLRFDRSGDLPMLTLVSPHCPPHELSVEVCRTQATIAYSDGLPPGPAERLFIWNDAPLDEGLDAVRESVAALVQGKIILVRERLSPFIRLLRRRDCDSLLWFVANRDFERWSRRRRRRVQRAWSWDGAPRFTV